MTTGLKLVDTRQTGHYSPIETNQVRHLTLRNISDKDSLSVQSHIPFIGTWHLLEAILLCRNLCPVLSVTIPWTQYRRIPNLCRVAGSVVDGFGVGPVAVRLERDFMTGSGAAVSDKVCPSSSDKL
jgi:hypothetical protein